MSYARQNSILNVKNIVCIVFSMLYRPEIVVEPGYPVSRNKTGLTETLFWSKSAIVAYYVVHLDFSVFVVISKN